MVEFQKWFEEAKTVEKAVEVNAMAVATCGKDLMPSVRYVLLKEVNQGGFVFYTNYGSKKSGQIDENPKVSCMFYWPTCNRSVRIEGHAVKVSAEESDAYFYSRDIKSQVASWVSRQSSEITQEEKEGMIENIDLTVAKIQAGEMTLKRPDYWGGFRIIPESIEFWQGKWARFHDRFLYER